MKPATPLPWSIENIGVTDAGPNGIDVFDVGPCDSQGEMRVRVATVAGDDAAYIAHACTAYPKLVDALQQASSFGMEADEAEAILRELGELK